MVSNSQAMENHRQQQYIPGPPPPPPAQNTNLSHLPPPPPRLPPPPPGPHPSSLPPGTVYGIPGGWQQGWGRPGMGQALPPPPPMMMSGQAQNKHIGYAPQRQPTQLNIPPPPPQYDKPILSATFIPGGDSFGPGVGIPPLEDYSSYASYSRYDNQSTNEPGRSSAEQKYSDGTYNPNSYSYPPPAQQINDISNRENRAASSSSNRAPFSVQKPDVSEPLSPGPPTAIPAGVGSSSATTGRQRAQSAAVAASGSADTASQWPLDRVLVWLAANGFSNDWQETFSVLKLEGSDFLELGRGPNGRGNLGKMHQTIYPQLAKICSNNNTGWDQSREREEGKRLRKLISRIAEGGDFPSSAGSGHRRRESGLVASASTEGTVENSPHLTRADFSTPSTAGPEGSPGKQMPAQFSAGSGIGPKNSQSRSSTLPVFSKHGSSGSTPVDSRPPDSLHGPNRADYTRSNLAGVGNRGRHSPNLSGDASTGLAPRGFEASPSSSPGLGYAVPSSATSSSSQRQRPEHSKSNSIDSTNKAAGLGRSSLNVPGSNDNSRGGTGNIVTTELSVPSRFYEAQNRRDGQEVSRASPSDGHRTFSNEYTPGPGGKDQSKGFLAKFMRKRHDQSQSTPEEQALESPTSPGTFRQMFPFSKPGANSSDSVLAQRPSSATAGLEDDKAGTRVRRGTRNSKRFILVTPDHWNYRLVDVTDVESAVALRSLICIELGIADAEYAQIFATEPGQTDHDEPLSDNLLVTARSRADNFANLKLYVHSPTMSAVTAPMTQSSGLGVSFPQRIQTGYLNSAVPMMKSNSAGGVNREMYPPMSMSMSPSSQQPSPNAESLQRAAEEYRKQTEAKQRAYLEARQTRKDTSTYVGSGIRSGTVIDFDSPRISPFEEKKPDPLVPLRKPPTAPSESSTLTKVNSLRAKTGSGKRGSIDALKRISDPIAEENVDRSKKNKGAAAAASSQGIGAALANVGRMAGTPASMAQDRPRALQSVDFNHRGSSPGGSPRPDFTWAKGNLLFKVPDYDETTDDGRRGQGTNTKPQNAAIQQLRRFDASPAVSPSSEHPRPTLQTRKSYGPDLEFKETNVSFAASPHPTQQDSDDDSDDGLFAIPLANKSMPKTSTQDTNGKDQRPTLTVDTDQHVRKARVAFKSPNSSGGVSINRTSGEDSATASGEGFDRSYSDGSFSGSAQSPDDRMNRRDSFVSDIWANRPAVENVVENLDEFFPGVDLDKPFMPERSDGVASPLKSADKTPTGLSTLRGRVTYGTEGLPLDFSRDRNESDTLGSDESTLKAKDRQTVSTVAHRQIGKSGGLGRMKSIREVAQRRNDLSRGPSVSVRVEPDQASSIVRRKSTKMFGANIVQIKPKPGNRLSTLDPIPQEDVPTEDTPKRQATFKIIRGQLIGKGTYGRVYLGMNATTGEFLAVKQVEVNQKVAGQDKDRIKEMVAALDQEIDTMKDLEHPNIVQYLGCERKEFSISIYLEYISGGSVGSCLRKHGKFEEAVVRSLTRQTLEGLSYLHDEGILHRDLKADNILLDLDGTCKISDFGISKKSDNIYGNDVTNSMQGSVFWMAPEVVRSQGQGYSAKIDIWSLGCVVLEMFAGKRPWSREEAIGAIFKLGNLNQAPPIPEDVSATATVEGLNFMYDCFQVNPHDRPTADNLLRHSTFCIKDPYYNFYDTLLAAKLRTSDAAPLGG